MSDLDPVSGLQQRLAQLEATLGHVRQGKAPPQPVDLLSWRAANLNVPPATTVGWRPPGWRLAAITRSLREDWHGLSESVRTWAIRFEERLGR